MIKIENIEIFGWQSAIRGMRNPLNSWDKSDSGWCDMEYVEGQAVYDDTDSVYIVGENDISLMKRLVNAGTDHRKFMRMINVFMDITAPLYWWKEYDTYKVGTVANSCSTMHKIQAKEFTLDDFSGEHLTDNSVDVLLQTITILNAYRNRYKIINDKNDWWQMIQLLPSSYNQKRTVQLNYEVLANMYKSRKNHKLDEWREFCKMVEELPYSELIVGEKENI